MWAHKANSQPPHKRISRPPASRKPRGHQLLVKEDREWADARQHRDHVVFRESKKYRGTPIAQTPRAGENSEKYQQVRNWFPFVNRPAFVMLTRNTFEKFMDLEGEMQTLVLDGSIVRPTGVEFVYRMQGEEVCYCKARWHPWKGQRCSCRGWVLQPGGSRNQQCIHQRS